MKSFKQFLIEQNTNTDHLRSFYRALVSAEHRGVVKDPSKFDKNLFIRTKYQPKNNISTAYGPAQITLQTAQDAITRHKSEFDPNTIEYVNQFIEQGKKMKTSKADDSKYGYGCEGDLCDEKYQEPYESMSTSIIKGKLKDANISYDKPLEGEALTKATERWRGVSEKEDPEYFKIVREKYTSALNAPNQTPQKVEQKVENKPEDSEFHTIQSGDTMWKLGGGTPEGSKKIQDLNPGIDPAKLKPGQKIKIR